MRSPSLGPLALVVTVTMGMAPTVACSRKTTSTADLRSATPDPSARPLAAGAKMPAPRSMPSAMPSGTPPPDPRTPCAWETAFEAEPWRSPATTEDGSVTVFRWVDPADADHEALCVQKKDGPAQVLLFARAEPPAGEPTKNLTGFDHLVLTPDGRTVYFSTSAWVTESAVHAIDLPPAKDTVRFVHAGRVLGAIDKGPYRGKLVIHYVSGLGSDMEGHTFVATPDGKRVRDLPTEHQAIARILGTDVVERTTLRWEP